jgi:hypothetical protein
VIESDEEQGRDLSRLVVARAGRLVTTGDAHEPYQVVGPGGEIVEPVSVFLRDLLASGKSESTLRSYSVDLLRWWRFLLCTCQARVSGAASAAPEVTSS